MVDGIQVHKVVAVSRSKSDNIWIYNTVCTGYIWSPLTMTREVIVANMKP
jgi:hypothetical protein